MSHLFSAAALSPQISLLAFLSFSTNPNLGQQSLCPQRSVQINVDFKGGLKQ